VSILAYILSILLQRTWKICVISINFFAVYIIKSDFSEVEYVVHFVMILSFVDRKYFTISFVRKKNLLKQRVLYRFDIFLVITRKLTDSARIAIQ